jgi:hypothetical protein
MLDLTDVSFGFGYNVTLLFGACTYGICYKHNKFLMGLSVLRHTWV